MTFINIACIVLAFFAGITNAAHSEPPFGQVMFSIILCAMAILIGLANNGVIG